MAESIETRTEQEREQAKIEMIRRGLESDFWHWYSSALRLDLEQDLLDLASPDTPAEQVQYLRGKIRAKNELLLLPGQLVSAYDAEQMESGEEEELGPDILGRRLSPVPRNVED